MMFPTLIAGGFSVLMMSAGHALANNADQPASELEAPTTLFAPEIAPDTFPTDAMAEQFRAYLAWTKARGLSRLAAFEQLHRAGVDATPEQAMAAQLPSREMAEQFAAYLKWTQERELGKFYAFKAVDFD